MALTKTDLTRYTDDKNTVLVDGMTEPALGSAAFQSASTFLRVDLNLGDVANIDVARGKLGLKTAAVHDVKLTSGIPDYSLGKGNTDAVVTFGNLGDAAFTDIAAILKQVPAPVAPPGFTFTDTGYVIGTGSALGISPRIRDIDPYQPAEDHELYFGKDGNAVAWTNDGTGGAFLSVAHRIPPQVVSRGGHTAATFRNYITSNGRQGGSPSNTRTNTGTRAVVELQDCRAPSIGHEALAIETNYAEANDPWFGTLDRIFVIKGDGNTYGDGIYATPAADYAEWFQTVDDEHIDPGFSVVLQDGRVRRATSEDLASSIIGVTRPWDAVGVLGNSAELKWAGRYLKDAFGSYRRTRDGAKIQNPAYDSSLPYSPRSERPGWAVVGLLGQVPLRAGQPVGDRWVAMGPYDTGTGLWLVR